MEDNRKALEEQKNTLTEERASKVSSLTEIANKASEEKRAISADENQTVVQLRADIAEIDEKIKNIDATIALLEEVKGNLEEEKGNENEGGNEDMQNQNNTQDTEVRAFLAYVKGEEVRNGELTFEGGKALVPKKIADKIVTKMRELSPIVDKATKYFVKGELSIPVFDNASGPAMAYATEFQALASSTGSFTSVDLKGFLAGTLCLISKSLLNNTELDLEGFIVDEVAKNAVAFLEKECLVGTSQKIAGLSTLNASVAVTGTFDLDDLIELQNGLISAYQKGAIWIMSRANALAVKQMKDTNDRPLLQPDPSAEFGYKLLGKDFFVSDNCPDTVIYYGDMSGLAIKWAEEGSIEVLRERYADMHAVGVIDWTEVDAKVADVQKIKKMTVTSGE